MYWLAVGVFAIGLTNSYEHGGFARMHQLADRVALSAERAAQNGLSKIAMAEVMMGRNPVEVSRLQAALARLEANEAMRSAQTEELAQAELQLQDLHAQMQKLKSAASGWKCQRHEVVQASAAQDQSEVAQVQVEAAQQRIEVFQEQAEAAREQAQEQAEADREQAQARAEADREQAQAQAEFNREQAEAARERAREVREQMNEVRDQRVEMQVSRFETPEINVQVPEVHVPTIHVPSVHVPEVRVPAIHVRVPRVDVRVPQFTARQFMVNDTKIDLSGVPGIDSFKSLDCPHGQVHIHVQTDKPHTTI
jgi:hypothetical protein